MIGSISRARRPASMRFLPLLACFWLSLPAPAVLAAPPTAPPPSTSDAEPEEVIVEATPIRAAQTKSARPGLAAGLPGGPTLAANDTFMLFRHGFDTRGGDCDMRGWTVEELAPRVFAHTSDRFLVNDAFIAMGNRALSFGADSISAPDEVGQWQRSFGLGTGWSQRLTSPPFSLAAHPGATLRFDASIRMVHAATVPTSGMAGNRFLAAQALRQDGSWTFLNARFEVSPGAMTPLPGILTTGRAGGIAVDDSGNVYAVFFSTRQVRKYGPGGNLLLQWGTAGTGPGQFVSPLRIEVDRQSNVYVIDFDSSNPRVIKFTSMGVFLTEWGGQGSGPGTFSDPNGVAVALDGSVLVTDTGNNRVQRFDSDGNFIEQWANVGPDPGQLLSPAGIAVDPVNGDVYVSDFSSYYVHRFSADGTFLNRWGGYGSGPGTFIGPFGIAVGPGPVVYVCDNFNGRVQVFQPDGTFLDEIATSAYAATGASNPYDVAVAPGRVYIADWGQGRVYAIGAPNSAVNGRSVFRCEVPLDADGNELLSLAEPLQVRVVMQSGGTKPDASGPPTDTTYAVIDNLTLSDGAGDILAPVDFEDGGLGPWTLSAQNGSWQATAAVQSFTRDFTVVGSEPTLASGSDPLDPTCAWSFLDAGGIAPDGRYVRVNSPWFAPRALRFTLGYSIRGTAIGRFWSFGVRGKRAGALRPVWYQNYAFLVYDGNSFDDAAYPVNDYSQEFDLSGQSPADSVQLVFYVLDQPERFGPFTGRPPTKLPIIDNLGIYLIGVDGDHDGVQDPADSCPTVSAAGQDADGDGCPDANANLRSVENWSQADRPVRFTLSQASLPGVGDGSDATALRDAFATWQAAPGASVPLAEQPATSRTDASALDGVNLVSFLDDFEFPPNVLAVTPTTSFLVRSSYFDDVVLPGQIVDADIVFNPSARFSTATVPGGPGSFDLKSTAVHEIGHLLGLSHSGIQDATMYPVLQPGEGAASLEEDDAAAVAGAFPGPTYATDYGAITGSITRGGSGLPLRGALVTAYRADPGGGPDIASTCDYTDESGRYALRRLVPGNYAVRVDPLDGSIPGVLPGAINPRVAAIAETDFQPEWYGGPESDRDDPSQRDLVVVAAASTVPNLDLVTNIDVTAPWVVNASPVADASAVRIDTPLLVNFSEPVDANTIGDAFRLRVRGSTGRLGGRGQLITPGLSFVFVPEAPLAFSTDYELEVTSALTDRAGVPLASPFLQAFRTQDRPAVAISDVQPRQGPVGSYLTIAGAGFEPTGVNQVRFPVSGGGTREVAATQVTPTSLIIEVPADAVSGSLQVLVGNETSNPYNFNVLPGTVQAPIPSGAPIALPFAPRDVALAPDARAAFAVGPEGLALIGLDSAQPGYLTAVPTGLIGGERIALSPDGLRGYVTRPDHGDVTEIDADPASATAGQVLGHIAVGGAPEGVVVTASGQRAWVSDRLGERLFELDVDPASAGYRSALREIVVPDAVLSGGLALDPATGGLLAGTLDRGVVAVDIAGAGAAAVVHPTAAGSGLAVAPDGARLFSSAAEPAQPSLQYAGPLSGSPTSGSTFIGGELSDVLVAPGGGVLYATNAVFGSLHVLDLTRGAPQLAARLATASAPRAVAASADGGLIAVANAGGRSVSLYQVGAPVALERVTPASAMPGDAAALRLASGTFGPGSVVDVGATSVTPYYSAGVGAAFVVPSAVQGEAGVAVTSGGGRTLTVPFRIVDRIEGLGPRATGLVPGPEPALCGATTVAGRLSALRASADARFVALARDAVGCLYLDLYDEHGAGPGGFGARLLDGVSLGTGGAGADLAFTPDGRSIWVSGAGPGLSSVGTEPGDPGFGLVAAFGAAQTGAVSALATDPLGRWMLVAAEPSPGTFALQFWNADQTLVSSLPLTSRAGSLAVSPDGRTLVVGHTGAATFVDLATRAVLRTSPSHAPAAVVSTAVTADGKRGAGLFDNGAVAVWNLDPGAGLVGAELAFASPFGAGVIPTQLVPAPDGDGLLAGCANCTDLYKLEPTQLGPAGPALSAAPLGQPARALARSVDGRRLWIADWDDGTLAGSVRVFSTSEATRISAVAGVEQSAAAGQPLPLPVRVQVTDDFGRPQVGVALRFSLPDAASGLLDSQPRTNLDRLTDANGEAAVAWTMPAAPGRFVLTATALGSGASLQARAEALLDDALAAPVVIALGPPDGSSGLRAGTALFARFSQRMDSLSLKPLLTLQNEGGAVPYSLRFEEERRLVIVQPLVQLPYSASCTFSVGAGALDLEGQALATGATTTFTVEPPPILTITALSPQTGVEATQVTILGEGFSPVAAQNVVRFNGLQAIVSRASETSLATSAPVGFTEGPVTVEVGGVVSNGVTFYVPPPNPSPFVLSDDFDARTGIQDLAITPDGQRVYITNPATNSVLAFRIDPPTFIGLIPVGLSPQAIAILPDGSRAYVANSGSDDVSVIDVDPASPGYNQALKTPAGGSPSYPVAVGDQPIDAAVSSFGPSVLVVNAGNGTLSIIDARGSDATADAVTTTVKLGSGGQQVAVTPDGTRAFVATAQGVVEVSLLSKAVTTTISTGTGGKQVAVMPDGTLLFVLNEDGVLLVVDISPGSQTQNQVLTTVSTGTGGKQVAVNPDGTLLYVTVQDGNLVLVFEVQRSAFAGGVASAPGPSISLTLVESIPVGNAPAGIVMAPLGGFALVANEGDGRVSILSTTPKPPPGPVVVQFSLDPANLNFANPTKRKYAEATIEPPPAYSVHDIPLDSLRLNGTLGYDPTGQVIIGDKDADGVPDLTVKFSWTALKNLLPAGEAVIVRLTGRIGTLAMSGQDTVRVVQPPKKSGGLDFAPDVLALAVTGANPASGPVSLRFGLPEDAEVTLEIYDVMGRRVETLARGRHPAGWQDLTWEGRNDAGARVGAGIYFIRLRSAGLELRRRVVLLR